MSKLTAVDLAFLLLERSRRPTHMAGFQIFSLPARGRKTFISRLLGVLRDGEVGKPFNQKLKWHGRTSASWEIVEADPMFHVRHLALPAPGSMDQFYHVLSFLNSSLLDRERPLWECYVIEGLEDDKFAIFTKIHHALIDGQGAMKLYDNFLSTSSTDRTMRSLFNQAQQPKKRRRSRSDDAQLTKMLKNLSSMPSALVDFGSGLLDLGVSKFGEGARKSPPPFAARKTLFNNTPGSSERRYGDCELPLERVKAVARASETKLNDVMMAVIDDALHRYLRDFDAPAKAPLVTTMAMSFRSEQHGSKGNQVSADLVKLGQPGAKLPERLRQIHEATTSVKEASGKLPVALRQLYVLLLSGTGTLPEFSTAFQSIPSHNLIISNMVGPREQLYLAGAPMKKFGGLPIVPPGCGLNVTFGSMHDVISLAIGAAPEAVEQPQLLASYITDAFGRLERSVLGAPVKKRASKPSSRKPRKQQ